MDAKENKVVVDQLMHKCKKASIRKSSIKSYNLKDKSENMLLNFLKQPPSKHQKDGLLNSVIDSD